MNRKSYFLFQIIYFLEEITAILILAGMPKLEFY